MNALRLLIVDDDESTRMLVRRVAQTIDLFEISEAVDGKQALDFIQQTKPDLLILDWEMPEINGQGVLTALNQQKLHKDITIMMLTVNKEKDVINEAITLGACDYVVKPLNIPMFKIRLEKLIERHNKRTIANLMDQF